MSKYSVPVCLLACALIALPLGRASAQSSVAAVQKNNPSTVVVLRCDCVENGTRASIFVRPGATPEAVIAVPKGSSEEDLAEAFQAVVNMHKRLKKGGEAFPAGAIARRDLKGPRSTRKLSDEERKSYRAYLTSFEKSNEVDVPAVGRGRGVEVQMPEWP